MLMLAGLMGLLVAGMAVDMSAFTETAPDDAAADDLSEGNAAGNDLPPIMPQIDNPDNPGDADSPIVAEVSSFAPDTGLVDLDAPAGEPTGGGTAGIGIGPSGEPEETPEQTLAAIIGSENADALMGGAGDDRLEGLGGSDDLRGGLGDDTMFGGTGNDWLQGDAAYGLGGDDELHGGAGDDSLAGQGGNDLLWGDEGDDTLLGGDGNDLLFGGAGNDWLSGNAGDDVLISGGGSDDLDAGDGNDLLIGGDDDETVWMHGGAGDDTLMPGAGDFAEGSAGADHFFLKPTEGDLPIIADFDGDEDQIILHLPPTLADGVAIDLIRDGDGTTLITVNGEAIGRMLQDGGLRIADIGVVRLAS